MRTVSLVIPHFNRFDLLLECAGKVADDSRISEIVISDDCSTDGSYERLQQHFKGDEKVKLFQNEKNLDCYRNKRAGVSRATNEWVILFDDDNIMPMAYLDRLYDIPEWDKDTIHCPDFAEPFFNYTALAGSVVSRQNVRNWMEKPHFATALNTCNYFVHRDGYLSAWKGDVDPHTADSIYQAYNWFLSDRRLLIVPGLRYFHRVHPGSHFKNNVHKTGSFAKEIENKLKQMR